MKKQLFAVLLGFATVASAHFVFVVPQPGGATAQVFISEDLYTHGRGGCRNRGQGQS